MSSSFGDKLKVTIFGASHGSHIGVVLEGLDAGEMIDKTALAQFMQRRAPKKNVLSTQRREADEVTFVSGVLDDKTSGSPLCALIQNTDAHSKDYANLEDVPRPSHADYTARLRFGEAVDLRGGGHFSGRLTAPLCIAGGIALQLLARKGIEIYAHLKSVGEVEDSPLDGLTPDIHLLKVAQGRGVPMVSEARAREAEALIQTLRQEGDSVGGVIECFAIGFPRGKGNPLFDSIESNLAKVLFGVSGVKGVSFGSGFDGVRHRGSEENDPFSVDAQGQIITKKNNSGGIQGGISNGMPIYFQVAMKPTPSIAKVQESISLSNNMPTDLRIQGRHDPCIAIRAVPVIEAVCALVLLDFLS